MTFIAPTDESLTVNLAGTATDDKGVDERPGHPPGPRHRSLPAAQRHHGAPPSAYRDATLGTPNGDQHHLVAAADHPAHRRQLALLGRRPSTPRGQQDPRARPPATYRVYPDDGPPALSDTLGQPQTGATFDRRARSWSPAAPRTRPTQYAGIAAVQVGVVNTRRPVHELVGHLHQHHARASARRSSTARAASGRTTRTRRRSSRPGPTASIVRPVDVHNQIGAERTLDRHHGHAAVEQPAGGRASPTPATRTSAPSTAAARPTRTPRSLTYTWSFGAPGLRVPARCPRRPSRAARAPSR